MTAPRKLGEPHRCYGTDPEDERRRCVNRVEWNAGTDYCRTCIDEERTQVIDPRHYRKEGRAKART